MRLPFLLLSVLLLTWALSSAAFAEENAGSKMLGCFDVQWEMTTDMQANVRIVINDEPLAQFILGPGEPFRQFYLSSENNTAEGRMRMRYKPEKGKAYLKMDTFTYRCFSPHERNFSGILAEFDLPAPPAAE